MPRAGRSALVLLGFARSAPHGAHSGRKLFSRKAEGRRPALADLLLARGAPALPLRTPRRSEPLPPPPNPEPAPRAATVSLSPGTYLSPCPGPWSGRNRLRSQRPLHVSRPRCLRSLVPDAPVVRKGGASSGPSARRTPGHGYDAALRPGHPWPLARPPAHRLRTMKTLLLAPLALATLAATAVAQLEAPKKSPQASVTQHVATTEVKIDYHRPAVRGRTVWGELVPYGKVWRAGANAARRSRSAATSRSAASRSRRGATRSSSCRARKARGRCTSTRTRTSGARTTTTRRRTWPRST